MSFQGFQLISMSWIDVGSWNGEKGMLTLRQRIAHRCSGKSTGLRAGLSGFCPSLVLISSAAWLSFSCPGLHFGKIRRWDKMSLRSLFLFNISWVYEKHFYSHIPTKIFQPSCSLLSNIHVAANMELLREESYQLAPFLPPLHLSPALLSL